MPRFFEVARQTFLLQVRGKVFLILTVLSVLFSCIFLVIPPDASAVSGNELFEMVAYGSAFTALLPFITLFLASQAIGGDIDDRTSVYLFTRPISRLSLLVGKWLAVILLAGVFVTIGMTSLFVVIGLGPREWQGGAEPTTTNYLAMLLAGWLAIVGYTSVGCLFAAFFRRPMLISVLYIFVEQFASRLPPQVGIHTLTVAFPTRVFMYKNMDECWELETTLRGAMDASREEQRMLMEVEPLTAIIKIMLFTMILAGLIYCRREYDSRPRE
jgi:ABC-type transport system involved in multi-copper enzyme maturation permease subunit